MSDINETDLKALKKEFLIELLLEQRETLAVKNKIIKKYEDTIETAYQHCLCQRGDPVGFDYHEKHPRRLDCKPGARVNTPRKVIEDWIGFTWIYEKPKGVCDSEKVLNLIKNKEKITKGYK